jgi:hypothetical protein
LILSSGCQMRGRVNPGCICCTLRWPWLRRHYRSYFLK